ncbi:MAG: ribonuclease H-like domain-containing protein [Nitrospirae bacterium]|nr:ribonuclease H-like domain-containing protein [Nitrospirota bacterium]
MLTSSFVLLKGLGQSSERRLWQEGILDWAAFLRSPTLPGISSARKEWYDGEIAMAQTRLNEGDAQFFGTCLKSREHWRLFETFRPRTLYLDIETTGLSAREGHVTVVGLYRNGQMTSLVRGETLTEDRLHAELEQTDLFVTFFGSGFDIPYLQAKYPRLNFKKPHFDLCFAARRLGMQGGLKHIEKALHIERAADVVGLDGWEAVRLWRQWCAGDVAARDLLLRYNAADTENLEPLAALIYDHMVARFGPASLGFPPTRHQEPAEVSP